MRLPRSGLPTVLLALATAAAAGVVAGVLLAGDQVPSWVEDSVSVQTLPASALHYDDVRTVVGTPVVSEPVDLLLADSGSVTVRACAAGGRLVSGTSPVTVDDRPVLALATAQPLWRDLDPTSRGVDVTALQDELIRLGHQVPATGAFDASTQAAVRALREQIGVTGVEETLPRSAVMWLPEAEVTVDVCRVAVGARVADGDVFASTAPSLTGLRIDAPSDLLAGDRVVTLGQSRAPVPATEGVRLPVVTDPTFLETVAGSAEYALLTAGVVDQPGLLTVSYALADPVDLLAVPPAALVMTEGANGCLVVDGGSVAVEVVASSLGQSLVRLPPGSSTPTQVELPAAGADCAVG